LSTVYLLCQQDALVLDGRDLTEMLRKDRWHHHNALYLPVAQLTQRALGAFGLEAEATLRLLSALPSGVACAFFFLAAREFGFGQPASLFGALLVATTPSVWFYATTIEVHALQLVPAVGLLYWSGRVLRRNRAVEGALVPTLLMLGLCGFHMSGALWAPAVAWVLCRRRGRWILPSQRWLSLGIVAGFLLVWRLGNRENSHGSGLATAVLERVATSFQPDLVPRYLRFFLDELLLPVFSVLVAAVLGSLSKPRGRAAIPLVILGLTFLPFAWSIRIRTEGGYFLSLVPVYGLLAVRWIDGARARQPYAIGLIVLGLFGGWHRARQWEEKYPKEPWITALVEDTQNCGVVLVALQEESYAVRVHTGLKTICIAKLRKRWEQHALDAALVSVGRALKPCGSIAVRTTIFSSDEEEMKLFGEQLRSRFGQPKPGSHPGYGILQGPKVTASAGREASSE